MVIIKFYPMMSMRFKSKLAIFVTYLLLMSPHKRQVGMVGGGLTSVFLKPQLWPSPHLSLNTCCHQIYNPTLLK